MRRVVATMAVLFSMEVTFASVNVLDFGAVANGNTNTPTDNRAAFERARAAALNGDRIVLVPAGTYQTRPFSAAGIIFKSAAPGSPKPRIKAYSIAGAPLVTLGTGSQLENIELDGGETPWYEGEGVHVPQQSKNVVIRGMHIRRFQGAAIFGDNVANNVALLESDFGIRIEGCWIENIRSRPGMEGLGIYLANSNRILIEGNTIVNAFRRGIFLWAEWRDADGRWYKIGRDAKIRNNTVVYDPSRYAWAEMQETGIEVHGTTNVEILANTVSGAKDVGLDVEWCDNVLISGNTVGNAKHACISVFFSSHGVSIANNIVKNDYQGLPTAGHTAFIGIWVTAQNRNPLTAKNPGRPFDYSNQDIAIRQNSIFLDPQKQGPRLSIFIQGYFNKNVVISENTDNWPNEKTVAIGGHDELLNRKIAEVNEQIDCSAGNCIQVPPSVNPLIESQTLEYLF